ncbi:unnamed protein product, partial [Urochloa humidicola]
MAAERRPERGAIELPCFEKATSISLDLRFLGLSVPPAGVFARLTELSLRGVRFHGPCDLGKAVSSARCPCLQKLTLQDARELHNLAIHSDSLKEVLLRQLRGLRQLTIMAPVLKELSVVQCFFYDRTQQPIANVSVPQLKSLAWADAYDPSSMHLGKMDQLKSLSTIFLAYGLEGYNRAFLMFMSHFKVVESLTLALGYMPLSYTMIWLVRQHLGLDVADGGGEAALFLADVADLDIHFFAELVDLAEHP